MVDDIVNGPLRFAIFVGEDTHAIDCFMVLLLHTAELLIYLEIIDVVHANLIVFQDLEQALVAFDKFVAVHIGLEVV